MLCRRLVVVLAELTAACVYVREKPVKVNTEADPKKEDTGKTETAKSGSQRQDSGEEPVKQDKEEEMKTAEQQTKEEGEETDMEMEEFERGLVYFNYQLLTSFSAFLCLLDVLCQFYCYK